MDRGDLSELIGAAYDAVLDASAWAQVLDATASRFQSRMISIRVYDGDQNELAMLAHGAALTQKLFNDYRDHWIRQDDHTATLSSHPEFWRRAIVPEHEMIDAELEAKSAYINEFLLPAGLGRAVCGFAAAADGRSTVTAFRAPGAAYATREELEAGAVYFPHLLRAAHMSARMPGGVSGVVDVFEDAPHAVLLFRDDGRLTWHNAHAVDLARRGAFRIQLNGKVASGALAELVVALGEAARRRRSENGDAPRFARLDCGDQKLLVRARTIGRNLGPAFVYQRASVLVEIRSLGLGAAVGERARDVFGLTPAESAVAVLLAGDASAVEIAEQRGVSPETIRGQTKAILAKVGVSRRAALISVLSKLSD